MKHLEYYLDVVQKKSSGGGGTGGITPTGTKEISITENGERTEDVTQYANAHIVVDVPVPDEPTGTKQITSNGLHDVKAFASAEVNVPIPEAPAGKKSIEITENGTTTHDVTEFAEAEVTVAVPIPEAPSGVKEISVKQNGVTTHDVADFAQAKVTVAVPEPTGEKSITENGKHDVKDFASVNVNVQSSGGGVDESRLQDVVNVLAGKVTDEEFINEDIIGLNGYDFFNNRKTRLYSLPNAKHVGDYVFAMDDINVEYC